MPSQGFFDAKKTTKTLLKNQSGEKKRQKRILITL
jgi:hypothetical protein